MNLRFFSLGFVILACIGLGPQAFAQAGNSNPGGVTAEYNGSSTVAGYYDPSTGNAKREITDIVVPGSIGAYPLQYTRTYNTRGMRGGQLAWTHNYQWSLSVRPPDMDPGNGDGFYDGPVMSIGYPNGGRFEQITYDSPWPIGANGPHGASDTLLNCSIAGSGCNAGAQYELRRADGGKVLFSGGKAYAIIDPYGQPTILTYVSGRLWKVTEPGGRYLQFNYYSYPYLAENGQWVSVTLLGNVQAYSSPGNLIETVSYGYDPVWITTGYTGVHDFNMTKAYYDDGAQATYTYRQSNMYHGVNTGNATYLNDLHTCDDPRYAGPMKFIEYDYVQWSEAPDFVGPGQIKAEKNVAGQVVSRTTFPTSNTDPNLMRRTETRGDGASRTISYDAAGFVWTDFKNKSWTENRFENSTTDYGWTIRDPRGNTTTYTRETVFNDGLKKITYPATADVGVTTREYTFDPNNPYLHSGEKDENGDWTYFDRDPANPDPNKKGQLRQIRYPDGSTEQFTYNGFGQVETHKLRNGGTENFRYDTRGRKTEYWPPPTPSDPNPEAHKTQYTYHNTGPHADRLYMEIDPRANATAYFYNPRGQVVRVQHQDYTYTQSSYNLDGTLAWTADENHPGAATDPNQRTRYTYDEYKRVLTVTNPVGETTTNYYGLDWANPLLHSTNAVKYTLSPLNKNVVFDYDANLRKTAQTVASGTSDVATTWFEYDEVGNLKKTTDPRSKVTTFGYNERNRKISMDSPIASDRNSLGHTMSWEYDGVGNKKKETRADDAFRSWVYDVPNRTTTAIDWRMSTSEPAITTRKTRDLPVANPSLTVEKTIDAKNKEYTFESDALGRKIKETYPLDATPQARSETWQYDLAGNMDRHVNVAGTTNTLHYDNRNRADTSTWSANGPVTETVYDAANRMMRVVTKEAGNVVTTVDFGYDAANRQIWEEQTLAGYPTRHIDMPRDDDGNRDYLFLPGVYLLYYDYTQRNQLYHINDGNNNPIWTYTYDKAGNVTNRFGQWGLPNGVNYGYDDANRITQVEQGNATEVFSRSHYQYDKVNREEATWRDGPQEQAGSKGEHFWFETNNQIKKAFYKANNAWTSTPSNPATFREYTYTADKLNWLSVNDNGYTAPFVANDLNQYTSVNGSVPHYDNRFNLDQFGGLNYNHNSANQLISVTGSHSASFTYDGLGRCVRRTVDGQTWIFAYDGWNAIVEWDQSGAFKATNLYGPKTDEILGRYDAVYGSLIYKQDKQGNVAFVLNPSNQTVEKYSYDAYGQPTIMDGAGNTRSQSAIGNRFMYTGREWIGELGIYDYRHRFYFPGIGRFLETDPMGLQTEGEKLSAGQKALFSPGGSAPEAFSSSEMNLFRYCHNDPVNKSDSTGLTIEIDTDASPEVQANAAAWLDSAGQSDAGKSALQQLMTSSNVHTITSFAKANDPRAEETQPTGSGAFNGKGSGSLIQIKPENATETKDVNGNTVKVPAGTLMTHALGHAAEIDKGQASRPPSDGERHAMTPQQYDNHASERGAIKLENEDRKVKGLIPR